MFEQDIPLDIIGDIHGCYYTLLNLLEKLGYKKQNGFFQHPERKIIFLGDVVDRGNFIKESLEIVFEMVQHKQALCILGNHEQSFLQWHTKYKNKFLKKHDFQGYRLIYKTLKSLRNSNDLKDMLDFCYTFPLFIEMENINLAHACYIQQNAELLTKMTKNNCFNEDLLIKSTIHNSLEKKITDVFLRGMQVKLPSPYKIIINGGKRNKIRAKFWIKNSQKMRDVVMPQDDNISEEISELEISSQESQNLFQHSPQNRILFVGHYWFKGMPKIINERLACVDYSAVRNDKLVSYRYDNEKNLNNSKFVYVETDFKDIK